MIRQMNLYFILDLLYLGLMLNEPRRGGQSTGRRWSAKHGTPAKSMVWTTTPKGWQNDNLIHFISLLCHPFGVVDIISSSSRGYASLHHHPVVVPALRASLHNRLPYKINYSFVRHFHFRNLSYYEIISVLNCLAERTNVISGHKYVAKVGKNI